MTTPSLIEIINAAIESRMVEVHTSIPASVRSYDSASQKVSVQPLIKSAFQDETDERVVQSLPVITNVPVSFIGSGDISITWPINRGDTGTLMFSEASIDKWKTRGDEVDPIDDRRFNLSDAIFIPGLRPLSKPISSSGTHGTAMVLSAPLIHAGGERSLSFADHVHLDAEGRPTTIATTPGTIKLKGA